MSDREVEFIVSSDVAGVTAIGRCGAEPIRRGDRFESLYRYRPRRYPEGIGDEAEREEEREVCLRVEHIQAYGRELDELGPGMTGSLGLSGEGGEPAMAGWVLGRPAEVVVANGSAKPRDQAKTIPERSKS